jgi:hypothetical protein
MKTDLELQKLLAKELPELIIYCDCGCNGFAWKQSERGWGCEVSTREWLWIAAECEKKLSLHQGSLQKYSQELINNYGAYGCIFTTWQQRGIAYLKTIGKME